VPALLPYQERLSCLQQAGVGLWDVLASCRRKGSLDAAIEHGSERPVPLVEQLPHMPQLRAIACNGAAAGKLFQRHLASGIHAHRPEIAFFFLPSTSPANAAFSLQRLRQHWQVVADASCTPINAALAHKKP